MNIIKIVAIFLIITLNEAAIAASTTDIEKLTTYSVLLGRAIACGINTKDASSKVGYWIDKRFPPGSEDQITYLPIFMQGMQYHAQQQSLGKSPDDCSAVSRAYNSMPWPQ